MLLALCVISSHWPRYWEHLQPVYLQQLFVSLNISMWIMWSLWLVEYSCWFQMGWFEYFGKYSWIKVSLSVCRMPRKPVSTNNPQRSASPWVESPRYCESSKENSRKATVTRITTLYNHAEWTTISEYTSSLKADALQKETKSASTPFKPRTGIWDYRKRKCSFLLLLAASFSF